MAVTDVKADTLWWMGPRMTDWPALFQIITLCRTLDPSKNVLTKCFSADCRTV